MGDSTSQIEIESFRGGLHSDLNTGAGLHLGSTPDIDFGKSDPGIFIDSANTTSNIIMGPIAVCLVSFLKQCRAGKRDLTEGPLRDCAEDLLDPGQYRAGA